MTIATVDKLIWVLIYGGLLALSLGVFVAQRHDTLGLAIGAVGMVGAVSGAVLVAVRARMKTPSDDKA
jgi:hypothetical protein